MSLRALICHIGRLMHQAHYIGGVAGCISARLDSKRILTTPDGVSKGFLQPDQLLVVEIGTERGGSTRVAATSDMLMHLECYAQRPDISGVVNANPPSALALTVAGISMRTCVLPEAVIVLGIVPTASYHTPASAESQEAIRALISQHEAILLSHFGSLTVGVDVWQAYLRLETLEHAAMILHRAAQLGPLPVLPPEEVSRLLDIRRRLGYWHPGDEERFCEACGVC